MLLYKNFARSIDSTKKKFETSAEFELQAQVEQNEMFDKMPLICNRLGFRV